MESPSPPTPTEIYLRERIQFLEQLVHSKDEEINQLKKDIGTEKKTSQEPGFMESHTLRTSPECSSSIGSSLNESSSSLNVALSNPVILEEIFKYTSAKELRLVCKTWNAVLLSHSRPKIKLNLLRWMNDLNVPRETDISHLARSISVRHVYSAPARAEFATLIHFLSTFCQRYSATIRILEIHGNDELFYKIHTILQHSCPNLSELNLIWVRGGEDVRRHELGELSLKPKLKRVKIHQNLGHEDEISVSPCFSRFWQSILKSAPNLEVLVLKSPTLADLEGSAPLKTLECDLYLPEEGRRLEFHTHMKTLSKMLSRVSNSLQILKLHSNATDDSLEWLPKDERRKYFKLPKMPKLKKFVNRSLHFFQLLPNRDDISARNLPHLEILKLTTSELNEVQESLVRFTDPNGSFRSGARILKLDDVMDSDLLRRLRTPFPDLRELDVTFWRDGKIEVLVDACLSLGLKRLKIRVGFSYHFSKLLAGLWQSRQGLEGMEGLEIINIEECEEDLDFGYKQERQKKMELFENVLLLSKNMEKMTFVNFRIMCHSGQRIFNFIRDHGLRVYFKSE